MGLYSDSPGDAMYSSLFDFSPLGNLPGDYYKTQEQKRQFDVARTFQGGLPRDAAGNLDFNRAAEMLAVRGDASQLVPLSNIARQQDAAKSVGPLLSDIFGPNQSPGPQSAAPQATPDQGEPRGVRNSNFGNIKDGSFAQSQPGYAGSDGTFAKFETPEHGIQAATTLLGRYGQAGINTIQGVIQRWAPAGADGNNPAAYAATVSNALGIAPDTPLDLSDPQVRSSLARAMFTVENGKPVGGAAATAPERPAIPPHGIPQGSADGSPPPAPPVRVAGPATASGPPSGASGPATAPQPRQTPQQSGPTGQPVNPAEGFSPQAVRLMTALANPDLGDGARQSLTLSLQRLLPQDNKIMTLPDGSLVAVNARTNQAQQIYQGTKPTFTQIGEDMFGNKQYGFVDPITQKVTDVSGKPISTAAAGGEQAGASPNSAYLAKGVTQLDSSLSGDDYLKQFAPEVQSAVRNYLAGNAQSTGNPRKGFTQTIKMIATKYGEDIGMPADDTSIAARRTMRNDLSKTTPGSMGGQITFARTSINHLAEVARAAEALKNSDWGITPLSTAVNTVRGLGTEQAAKIRALEDAAQHYGQEVTKFYAGSPGGVAERDRFLTALSGARTPKELAAVIEQERRLIPERLGELDNRIQTVLGSLATKYPVHSKESEGALGKIDAAVSRMRGTAPPQTEQKPTTAQRGAQVVPAVTESKAELPARVRQNGHVYERQPDGSYVAAQ